MIFSRREGSSVMCIILCDNNSTFMCVLKKKERTAWSKEEIKEKLFQKFIAKCTMWRWWWLCTYEKNIIYGLQTTIRFASIFGAKENFMLCVLYVKWRTKFYNKKKQ